LREPDTRITMKLVYTLAGLATVLATGSQAFQLTTKNVRQLQTNLEDRVEQKYLNMKRQLRQKRGLFDGVLDQLAGEININEYNEAAADCEMSTAGFWQDCRQCIAQQCTSYMSQQCGSSLVPAELRGSNDFSDFLASRMAKVSPSIPEINRYLDILSNDGVKAEVDYQMNGADLKLSTRNRRSCSGDGCQIDCQQFVASANNMEVKCVNYNDLPQPLNAGADEAANDDKYPHTTDDAIFGNWKFTVQATHGHEMAEQGLSADGSIQIKLSVVDSDGDDYGIYDDSDNGLFGVPGFQSNPDLVKIDDDYSYGELRVSETRYPAQSGENAECNGAGCMHLGGNQFEVETEFNDDYNGFKFNCDGNESANCNQMIMDMPLEQIGNAEASEENSETGNLPCDEGGEPVEEIEPVDENFEGLFSEDIDSQSFCDTIGGCTDVPFVRRSSRGNNQRFNRAAKASICQNLETMPETCTMLGFNCGSCDKRISQECPDYHALRSELSKKISAASSLAEEFQTLTKANFEQVKFLHALNVDGAKAIYVQSATKDGDNVQLSIRVGSPSQAVNVLVAAKIKSADEWPAVSQKVADKVVELF
jgi:hypothetical protein